jgi:hypothetical protein
MKVFNRDGRVNFVDTNSTFVGYNMEQQCCEKANYFFSKTFPKLGVRPHLTFGIEATFDPTDWNFDPSFFKEESDESLNAGRRITFRLVKGEEERFLTLYNDHNGYYSHGFTFERKGTLLAEGAL